MKSVTQTIRPARNHLFCKPAEGITKTKSGFLLTEASAEKPQTAEVVNVGSSVESFKAHDQIIYKPYSTTDVKLNGEEYFLIAEEDVLGAVVDVK